MVIGIENKIAVVKKSLPRLNQVFSIRQGIDMKRTKINVYMIALIAALFVLLSAVIGVGFTESAIANAGDNESGGIEAPIVTGAIAKIGENEYDTFEEAVAALQDGDTLMVLHDFSIDENVTTSKNITFDLNGKKISTSSRGNPMLTFNGKTTVIDSSENKTGEVAAWIDIECKATPDEGETYCSFVRGGIFSDMITFDSNTLITGGKYTRYASPSGTNVKIEGGEFVYVDDESSLSISSQELTISGGTFTAPVKVNVNPTSVHISGGTFSSFSVSGGYTRSDKMDIQISGGTFGKISTGIYSHADFIKKGYIYTNASTGEYISAEQMLYNTEEVKVVECTSHVIENGVCNRCGADCPHAHASTSDGGLLVCSDCGAEIAASITRDERLYFSSLEDAFKAVQSGETITLESKIDCTNLNSTKHESIDNCTSVHVTTNCTLEYKADCYLNTGSSFYTLIVDEGVSLAFKDQSEQGLDRVENRAKIKNSGEFTANGMFYEYFDNYGTLKGGHFYYKDDETTMVKNYGTIEDGDFSSVVENYGTISGGTYYYNVTNVGADSKIIDGNMFATIVNYGTIGKLNGTSNMDIDSIENKGIIYEGNVNIVKNYGTIAGGKYNNEVTNTGCENEGTIIVGTISGGTFNYTVTNESYNTEHAKITGGKFTYIVTNNGTISGGTFTAQTTNNGTITSGSFSKGVTNNGIISGGSFTSATNNANATISGGTFTNQVTNGGTISDGTFEGTVTNTRFIKGGIFNGEVYNQSATVDEVTYRGTISGGTFDGTVYNSAIVTGGTFVKLKIDSAQDSVDCYISGGTYTGNGTSTTPNLEFFSSSSSGPVLPSTGGNSMLPSTGGNSTLPTTSSNASYLGKYLADGYAFFKIEDDTLGGTYYYFGAGLYDVYVAPHTHSFVEGKCECGYECNHEGFWNVNENGVCSNCDYHCKHSDVRENVCFVCGNNICAQITDATETTKYVLFSDALAALKDGDTLMLLADVTISGEKRIEESITLDLNGKTINGEENSNINLLYFHNDSKTTNVVIKNSASTVGTIKVGIETWYAAMSVTGNVSFEKDVYIDSNLIVSGGSNCFVNLIIQGIGNTALFSEEFTVTDTLTLRNTTTNINSYCNIENLLIGDCDNRECSLSITGASVTSLTVKKCAISVKLAEGTFTTITLDGTRLTYADLLADGQAYTIDSQTNFVSPASISASSQYIKVCLCSNHSWSDGACVYCLKVCEHSSWNEEYKCATCGVACAHDWEDGICDVCGKVCPHEGGSATCIVKATCTICGELYGDVDANGHHLEFIPAVAATIVKQGCIEHYACTYCHKCFEDALGMHEIAYEDTITPMIPSIVEGANGEYVRESGSGLVFKSNADSKDFIGVSVDGIVIDEENYDKIDGGLIIGLKTEYLETLSDGTHAISIVSTGGEATTNFTVEAAPKEGLSAGAWAGIGIAIAVVVVGAMIGIILAFKKRD